MDAMYDMSFKIRKGSLSGRHLTKQTEKPNCYSRHATRIQTYVFTGVAYT